MENIDEVAAVDPSIAASSKILETEPASSNPLREALPSGIIIEIFQYLDLHSLLKCRVVCPGFQSLIDSIASIQYQIELAVAGQQDGSYRDMFTRREMLKMHQKRWDELQWTEVLRMPMVSSFWGLYGGVFAQYLSQANTLNLKRIPSKSRGIKEKDWILDLSTLFGEETSMGNFGMDPSQDLLVVVARSRVRTDRGTKIHLLTLSKGERHPLTSEPCLVPEGLVSAGRVQWFYIDICHDFLSIRLIGGIVIWNWKTGQVLMHIVGSDITSMIFLNERYVLMATKGEFHPYLLAVDFLAGIPEPQPLHELENCFIFWFPDVSIKSPIDNIVVRSNPRSTREADTDLSVPFSLVPQNRLFVVYLSFDNMDEDLCFAILEASFLSLIKTGLCVNNKSFDWSMWGPEHSRTLLNESSEYLPLLPSHGTRIAMRRYLPNRGILVNVYDFNQLRCRKKKQDSDEETPGNMDVSEGSGIIEGRPVCVPAPIRIKANIFHDQVETRLGYTVTSRFVSERIKSTSVMCSEDAVIVVEEACRMYEIYTV